MASNFSIKKFDVNNNFVGRAGTAEIFNEMWDSISNPVYKAAEISNIILNVKDENSKLQKTEEVIYIIWNLPCYITCPNATESCKIACYAASSEKGQRENTVVPSRYRNLAACTGDNADTFVSNMIYTIEKQLAKPSYANKKTIRVRIHESGDFFSREYAMQWLQIARHFRNDKRVVFMAYTKSFSFFDGVKLPSNFVLRASIWEDTSLEDLETIKQNNWSVYMALPSSLVEYALKKRFVLCDCENCSTCEKHCFTRKNKKMFVVVHGRDAKKLENNIERLTFIIDMFSGK